MNARQAEQAKQERVEAEGEMMARLPYEATLTIMAPHGDGPEARAARRRLLAARDLASRVLGRPRYSDEMGWLTHALLRIAGEYCYSAASCERLELAVDFAVQQWNAMTALHRLEKHERLQQSTGDDTA